MGTSVAAYPSLGKFVMETSLSYAFLVFGLLPLCFAGQLPNVKQMDCPNHLESSMSFDNCLEINYPDQSTQFAGLINFMNQTDIMEGSLFSHEGIQIQGSRVSATRDADDRKYMMVMISNPSKGEFYQLKVDLETGQSENAGFKGNLPSDVDDNSSAEDSDRMPMNRATSLPEGRFILRVHFVLDDEFRKKFRLTQNQRAAIDRLLVHANTFFSHPSLGPTITLKYRLTIYIKGCYTPSFSTQGKKLKKFTDIINKNVKDRAWPEADSYTLLTYDLKRRGCLFKAGDKGKTDGVGYHDTTCHENIGKRNNIVTYDKGDILYTAKILVHEIGHNLGMHHDFNEDENGYWVARYAENGDACSNIGGFMDYGRSVLNAKWTQCSIEDFTKYYDKVVSEDEDSQFCLPLETNIS